MPTSSAIWITLIGITSAVLGVWLTSFHSLSRRLVPFGGGALVGVALFWVLPEMAEIFDWSGAALWIAGGCLILFLIDRYLYPVCPACSPSHDHDHCSTRLHGFALPLLAAAALHAAMDGWSAATADTDVRISLGVLAGIAAHKIPEGLALGVIARASLKSRRAAVTWCLAAQVATLLGASLEAVVAPYLGTQGVHAALALVGGSFLYLGWHAIEGEFRRSGPSPALVPALTGVAGSSVLRFLLR